MTEPRHALVAREQVLHRALSTGQQVMMAIGVAIGTGLFLGSGLAVTVAGPAVVVSYGLGALLSLLLAAALTEMAVAHPAAGSFGLYAELYVSPFMGYAVRVSYWLMDLLATGGHLIAISIYMHYWWPAVPGAVWVAAAALGLVYLNTRAVGRLGALEYWLAMIKVAAIVLFVVLGTARLWGWLGGAPLGTRHYTDAGGFAPMGLLGVWFGLCFVIYSYIGVETVGVTAGEATDPSRSIPRAMSRMVFGLAAMYLAAAALIVGLVPWKQMGVGESPFVSVLRQSGIAGADSVMNFVVLTAALSSANANLYAVTRTLFSLARAGYVPDAWGAVSRRGVPIPALVVSSVGLAAAVLVRWLWPESAYVWFFGAALFGGLFVWLMIFVTHLRFRSRARASGERLPLRVPGAVAASLTGSAWMIALLLTTWWVPGLRITLLAGPIWLALLALGYRLSRPGARAASSLADPA